MKIKIIKYQTISKVETYETVIDTDDLPEDFQEQYDAGEVNEEYLNDLIDFDSQDWDLVSEDENIQDVEYEIEFD